MTQLRSILLTVMSLVVGLVCFQSPVGSTGTSGGTASAGWRQSSYYRPGYTYYGACYYNGYYYPPSYWYYEPVQIVQYYTPVYLPAVFDTYQVTGLKQYNTLGISAVSNLAAIPGQAEVTDTITRRTTTAAVGGVATGATTAGSSIVGAAQANTVNATEARLAAMERDVAEIKRLLLSGGVAPPNPGREKANPTEKVPEPKEKPAAKGIDDVMLKALQVNCAVCHDKSVANNHQLDKDGKDIAGTDGQPLLVGGGFVYFDDNKPTDWSEYQVNRIYKNLLEGKMPKGRKMKDEDGQAIVAYLSRLLDKRKAAKKEGE